MFTKNLNVNKISLSLFHPEIIISKGNGNSKRVPWTCSTSNLLAIRIGLSFLSIYNYKCTQNAELAYTLSIGSLSFAFSSGAWLGRTLILTPSASGLSKSLLINLISKEKFMLEQFLNGIFITPLLGILIILTEDLLSSSYFKHTT